MRGFHAGINLYYGGAGHLVEDNRLDNNLFVGISVSGNNNRVRRNAVYDTGGAPGNSSICGIIASANVIDNTVAGVFAAASVTGMFAYGLGNEVRGNQVLGLVAGGSSYTIGIYVGNSSMRIADNHISAASSAVTTGSGIYYAGTGKALCTGNTVANFTAAFPGCGASVNNLSLP